MIESFTCKKVRNVKLSKNISSTAKYTIFESNAKVYSEDGKLIAIFIKGAITDPKYVRAGRNLLRYKQGTTSRTIAAGVNKEKKERYTDGNIGSANKVSSSIVGFMENVGFWPCRQTSLYQKHEKVFDAETLKLIQFISKQFKKYAPQSFDKQKKFVGKLNPHMVLKDTVYTTITVNCDWRTRTHVDKGDFDSGLGNITVFDYTKSDLCKKGSPAESKQSWSKGEFLLPEYDIGFRINEGDLLFVDVHQIHCNNPIKGKGRVSLVCYAREGITKCQNMTKKEISDWQKFRGI